MINVTEKFEMGRVKNIVGKVENSGFQHFLLFPQCLQRVSFSRALEVGLCGKGKSIMSNRNAIFIHFLIFVCPVKFLNS